MAGSTTQAAAAGGSLERSQGSGMVLMTLATGQFLMTLDSSVMNVSIATVASDLGTTITGIQTAITLYTLVMASLMITGGKIGAIIGRRRALIVGSFIYAAGSLTTGLAPNLAVLIVGWSFVEGIGAALIMPAIVALVASNFPPAGRPRAYGLIASAAAIAVAAGPIIGGLVTTYASWRWVFIGEVVVAMVIAALSRRMQDAPPERGVRLDIVGAVLSAIGLALVVLGVLRSGTWGWVRPTADGPAWLGLSPVIWMILGGLAVLRIFLWYESRLVASNREPLVNPQMLRNNRLVAGLLMFSYQYMIQAGLFFTVPLFLSVALGLSAVQTGLRLLPLSLALLAAAAGIPRFLPNASPRKVIAVGLIAFLAGIVILMGALEYGAGAEIVTWPMLLAGLGAGSLASQLGSVTVGSVPEEESGEVGGLQNTVTNLGASLGTALAGSVLIAFLTASFLTGIQQNPAVPKSVAASATVQLSSGVQFISNADLKKALAEAGVPPGQSAVIVHENAEARLVALRAALAVLGVIAVVALFFNRRMPEEQPAATPPAEAGT
jgi:MFS family permease